MMRHKTRAMKRKDKKRDKGLVSGMIKGQFTHEITFLSKSLGQYSMLSVEITSKLLL